MYKNVTNICRHKNVFCLFNIAFVFRWIFTIPAHAGTCQCSPGTVNFTFYLNL